MSTLASRVSKALGCALLFTTFQSQASLVVSETLVTGDLMDGIQVTALLGNGTSETFSWSAIGTTAGNSGNAVIDAESLSGGVFGTGWSLTQQGFTLGNFDSGNVYGLWSFTDSGANASQIIISGLNASGEQIMAFDTGTLNDINDDTNGSGQGRSFQTASSDVTWTYGDKIVEELRSTLTVDLLNPGSNFTFLADTDLVTENGTGDVVIVVNDLVQDSTETALQNTGVESTASQQDINNEISSLPPTATDQDKATAVETALNSGTSDLNTAIIAAASETSTGGQPSEILVAIADDPTLLDDVASFDIDNIPDVSNDPAAQQRQEQVIAIVEEIVEQTVRDEWTVAGNGDIDVDIKPESGEVFIDLAVSDPNQTTQPLRFTNIIDTPFNSFFLDFELAFETLTGRLDISLDNVLLGTYLAADYQTQQFVSLEVTDSSLFGLTGAVLEFALFPGSPASASIGNLSFNFTQDVSEPSTLSVYGLLIALAMFARRKRSV